VGPAITVDIATDADPSTSIADAEKILLAKAISLLGRSAKENAQAAHSALIQERQKAFVKPGEKN